MLGSKKADSEKREHKTSKKLHRVYLEAKYTNPTRPKTCQFLHDAIISINPKPLYIPICTCALLGKPGKDEQFGLTFLAVLNEGRPKVGCGQTGVPKGLGLQFEHKCGILPYCRALRSLLYCRDFPSKSLCNYSAIRPKTAFLIERTPA